MCLHCTSWYVVSCATAVYDNMKARKRKVHAGRRELWGAVDRHGVLAQRASVSGRGRGGRGVVKTCDSLLYTVQANKAVKKAERQP